MKKYHLKRYSSTIDEFGQSIKAYSTVKEVSVAIFFSAEASLASNPLFSQVQYIGITFDSANFQKNDRLNDNFKIVQVINAGRHTILYLEEVK